MTQLARPTEKEEEVVSMLSSMMGNDVDATVALRVLRKFNGDIDKAADAMLAGDRGLQAEYPTTPKIVSTTPSNNVIDLTGDDEEMSRALQMSMESEPKPAEPMFGPSNREPDPQWAVVPTNAQQQLSNEDENFKQAIEASLAVPDDNEGEISEMIRQDGRPVALRAESPSLVYAALVVHALFHVPQMRERLSRVQPQDEDPITRLAELFTNLDLAQLSTLYDDSYLLSLGAQAAQVTSPTFVWSSEFVQSISNLIDQRMEDQGERLISFTTGHLEVIDGIVNLETSESPISTVPVEARADPSCPNDLISRLSATLNVYRPSGSGHDGIIDPSQIIVFTLKKSIPGTGSPPFDNFVYPKTMFMDQFLLANFEVANTKRLRQMEIQKRLFELEQQKGELTKYGNKDVLKNLNSSVHYFENIARVGDDPARQTFLDVTSAKLRKIILGVEAVLEKINQEVENLQEETKTLFDCPELQKLQYDLRAVLVHTGVPGRKQMYSYVQDRNGTWWKTLDYTVTETSEADVLTDPTGLHLDAGPYMLIYSRSLPKEELIAPNSWPPQFLDAVKLNNERFLESLSPEVLERAKRAEGPASGEKKQNFENSGKKRVTLSDEAKGSRDVSMMDLASGE
ncbi:hypothetical protein L218DRAFT_932236 [Marasmius fiardii PR-910]|nr:hypothetical protein L218DRAFT_932236 [Marasmius fiardii PR-910]